MVVLGVLVLAVVLSGIAEWLHARRCRRAALLAYGPARRPRSWVLPSFIIRPLAFGALAGGLTLLLTIPPKTHKEGVMEEDPRDIRHLIIVLDISPSMRLKDAGPKGAMTRTQWSDTLMESLFQRADLGQVRVSVIAVYTEAKPVVVDTSDIAVVYNILNDLPLHHVFPVGKTDLLAGLKKAAEIAKPWRKGSTSVMLMSDGDTIPAQGMPRMPNSVSDVLVVGVGDSRTGSFIDGHLSRQNVSMLRQIALRLKGSYHDGNRKHVPSIVMEGLLGGEGKKTKKNTGLREFAILAVVLAAFFLAFHSLALSLFGVAWTPSGDADHSASAVRREKSKVSSQSVEVSP